MADDPLANPDQDQESEDSDYEPVKETKAAAVKWDDEENSIQPVEESLNKVESEAQSEESEQEQEAAVESENESVAMSDIITRRKHTDTRKNLKKVEADKIKK